MIWFLHADFGVDRRVLFAGFVHRCVECEHVPDQSETLGMEFLAGKSGGRPVIVRRGTGTVEDDVLVLCRTSDSSARLK